MKKNKGITLIALVITIIVLLILAGVSIAMLTGENGLIAKAISAKNKTEEAEADEKDKLAKTNEIMDKYITNRDGSITVDKDSLNKLIDDRINEKMYSPNIFHGTSITNNMAASDNTTQVNQFTITENGKYVINYQGFLHWNSNSVFGLYLLKNSNIIAANMYSNNLSYESAGINLSSIQNLNAGDNIVVQIYQYSNGAAGVNNLTVNDLQLIKVGN